MSFKIGNKTFFKSKEKQDPYKPAIQRLKGNHSFMEFLVWLGEKRESAIRENDSVKDRMTRDELCGKIAMIDEILEEVVEGYWEQIFDDD